LLAHILAHFFAVHLAEREGKSGKNSDSQGTLFLRNDAIQGNPCFIVCPAEPTKRQRASAMPDRYAIRHPVFRYTMSNINAAEI
jgi:hypothetical protein